MPQQPVIYLPTYIRVSFILEAISMYIRCATNHTPHGLPISLLYFRSNIDRVVSTARNLSPNDLRRHLHPCIWRTALFPRFSYKDFEVLLRPAQGQGHCMYSFRSNCGRFLSLISLYEARYGQVRRLKCLNCFTLVHFIKDQRYPACIMWESISFGLSGDVKIEVIPLLKRLRRSYWRYLMMYIVSLSLSFFRRRST